MCFLPFGSNIVIASLLQAKTRAECSGSNVPTQQNKKEVIVRLLKIVHFPLKKRLLVSIR